MSEIIKMIVLGHREQSIVIKGATLMVADCGHTGWAAPSTIRFLADHQEQSLTICQDCVPRRIYEDPAAAKGVLPGSEAELTEHFGVARTDQMMAFARDRGFKNVAP